MPGFGEALFGGILGVCVGDALGVPVEFVEREKLDAHPLTEMVGYGTHNQHPGTWSDDSSLTLCLTESLCKGYNLEDQAVTLYRWLYECHWTARGRVFDIGLGTREALVRLHSGYPPIHAGGRDERSNGNGSLMRILPLALYLHVHHPDDPSQRCEMVADASSLTHAHPRSKLGCWIYIEIALQLLKGKAWKEAFSKGLDVVEELLPTQGDLAGEKSHYSRLFDRSISTLCRDQVKSSGYVVHTLEASTWSMFQHKTYEDIVLEGVNLGGDTDTIGAVVGGWAGLMLGQSSIPDDWLAQLARKDDILDLLTIFEATLST